MKAAGTAVPSSTRSRFTGRSSSTVVPSTRSRSKRRRTLLFFSPASQASSSKALRASTGWPSTPTSTSPGRMSCRAAAEPGLTLPTTAWSPTKRKAMGTGYSRPSCSARCRSGERRAASITYECGSAACTIPCTAAISSSCVSTLSGWFTRIWLRTWLNICRSS